MADAARVNGNLISWGSFEIKIDDEPYSGVTAVDYNHSRERAYAYGTGRHHSPRGRTAGKYTPEPLVITCWKSTAKAIRERLKAAASDGRSYGNAIVGIVLQYIEEDDDTVTVDAQECVLTKEEMSDEEGPEGLNEKLTFMPMRYVINDGTLYDSSAEAGA